MKKLLILTVLVLLVAALGSNAMDMTKKWGVGYFMDDTPLGVRFWLNEKTGIDIGIGLENADLGNETAMSYWASVGVPIVLFPTERANFFARPGVQIGVLDNRVYGSGPQDETLNQFVISLSLGGEVFFGNNFSLEAASGIAAAMTSYPDTPTGTPVDGTTDIFTFGAGVSSLGFHFYFR